jgi:hypothetical protein
MHDRDTGLSGQVPGTPVPGFWAQARVIVSPTLTWPGVCAAAAAGFIMCCATVAIVGGIETHRAGVPPWDRIKRGTPRRKLHMYVGQWLGVAVGCAIIAVGMLCVPILPILAVGVAPRAALRALGGGTVEAGGSEHG